MGKATGKPDKRQKGTKRGKKNDGNRRYIKEMRVYTTCVPMAPDDCMLHQQASFQDQE